MNSKLTQKELQAIKKRAENATEGPWHTPMRLILGKDGYVANTSRIADADFIAASRQDIPKLVAEVERLRKALEYYADDIHYDTYFFDDARCDVTEDGGHNAKEALG